jgi:hypothetical protein
MVDPLPVRHAQPVLRQEDEDSGVAIRHRCLEKPLEEPLTALLLPLF